jgi:hypothetical protein
VLFIFLFSSNLISKVNFHMSSDRRIVQYAYIFYQFEIRMLHFIWFNVHYIFIVRYFSEPGALYINDTFFILWQQMPWLHLCSAGIKVVRLQGCFRCVYICVCVLCNNHENVHNLN